MKREPRRRTNRVGPLRTLHRAFLVFGAVVSLSFLYGLYLIHAQGAAAPEWTRTILDEESPQQLLEMAETHLEEERVEQALMAFRQALTLEPESIEAQLGIADAELQAGREGVAASEYERALALDPAHPRALRQLGLIHARDSSTWDRSEEHLRAYVGLEPEDHEARLQLARVLAWTRQSEEAVEIYSDPQVARLMTIEDRRDHALALARTGRTMEAEAEIRDLLADRPGDFQLREQLAAIHAEREEWAEALPLYDELLRERPNDPELNLTYGMGLVATERHREAVAPLAQAREALPSSGEAGLAYARALQGAGDLRRAAQEFERILPQYQNDARIVREYGDLRLERSDYRRAEEAYKDALALGLRDTKLLVGLAGALRGDGKVSEAVRYLQEAYEREPTDRLAFELAATLHDAGRHEEALEVLEQVDTSQARGGG